MNAFYAHSTDSDDKSSWQPLAVHLQGVARLAEDFATVFGAGVWGRFAGLLHDAGKASEAFQRRLEGNPQRVDHATFGACIACVPSRRALTKDGTDHQDDDQQNQRSNHDFDQ